MKRQRKMVKVLVGLLIVAVGTMCFAGCSKDQGGSDAESYPSKDITVIIPFTAGGASDVQARIFDKYFKKEFGVSMVFEYKEGAGGEIGFTELAKKKADGYTIGGLNVPHIVLQPLARQTQYTYDSFDYVGQVVNDPQIVTVGKNSPYNSLSELLAAAKASPGKITMGSVGTFSGQHIAILKLMDLADVEFNIIPYKGSADEVIAMQGGHVDAIMGNLNDLNRDVEQYKMLAISTEERHEMVPDVPTFREEGYDLINGITRLFATPKGVDPAKIARLQEGFERIANNPEYLADMEKIGQPASWINGKDLYPLIQQENDEAIAVLTKYDLLRK